MPISNNPGAEGYRRYRGTFNNAESAWNYLHQVHWQPEDQAMYLEQAKRQNDVQRIFDALVDLKHHLDGRGTRSYENYAKRRYPQEILEAQCWALYNVIENLHIRGSTLLPHLDLSSEGSQDRKLNLAQRVSAVCFTLQHWKCVAADVANGYKLQELANAPLQYAVKLFNEPNANKAIRPDGTPFLGWEKAPEQNAALAAGPSRAPANDGPSAATPAFVQNVLYDPSIVPEGSFLVVRHDIYASHQEVTHEGVYSPSTDTPPVPFGGFSFVPANPPRYLSKPAAGTTIRAPKDSLGDARDSAPIAADKMKPVPRPQRSSPQPHSTSPDVSDAIVDSHDAPVGASSAQSTGSKRRRTSP